MTGAESGRLEAPVFLFLISMFIPSGFSLWLGPLRISAFRMVLLLATPFLMYRLLSGQVGKLSRSDWLTLAAASWIWLSLVVNDGTNAIESGGIIFAETFGAFLLGRCCIRTSGDWLKSIALMGMGMFIVSFFSVAESMTGQHLIRELSLSVSGKVLTDQQSEPNPRFGFERAFGPYDHPIHLGVMAATVTLGLIHASKFMKSLTVSVPGAALAALSSISSGAVAVLAVGTILSIWDAVARSFRRKWVVLLLVFGIMYAVVELLSNRSGLVVLLSYFTFNPKTAVGRTIIWDWGFHHNVLVRPFFGLGYIRGTLWTRPFWLKPSMDNYFLRLMVIHGMAVSILLLAAILIKVRAAVRVSRLPGFADVCISWWVPMFGFVIAAWTVDLWAHAQVYFWFMLGASGWIERIDAMRQPQIVRGAG